MLKQPTPRDKTRVCANCKAAEKMESQVVGTRLLTCHLNPPTPSIIYANGQLANNTSFPIVQENHWCLRWQATV